MLLDDVLGEGGGYPKPPPSLRQHGDVWSGILRAHNPVLRDRGGGGAVEGSTGGAAAAAAAGAAGAGERRAGVRLTQGVWLAPVSHRCTIRTACAVSREAVAGPHEAHVYVIYTSYLPFYFLPRVG